VAVGNPFSPFEGYPDQKKNCDYITIVLENKGGKGADAPTFYFKPHPRQHQKDVYFVCCFPPGGPTPPPTATANATPRPTPTPRSEPTPRIRPTPAPRP